MQTFDQVAFKTSVVQTKGGERTYVSPSREVSLVPKGEFVQFKGMRKGTYDDRETVKVDILVSEQIAEKIENIIKRLFDDYVKTLEEDEVSPALYLPIRRYGDETTLSVTVTELARIFSKKLDRITQSDLKHIIEGSDIFPILKFSSQWCLEISGKLTFGISIQLSQLLYIVSTKPKKTTKRFAIEEFFSTPIKRTKTLSSKQCDDLLDESSS